MRKLGVAAASAALIGTIVAVLPAGVAKADVTGVALPDPIAGVCGDVSSTDCWRGTSLVDVPGPDTHGTVPAVSGNRLVLNSPTEANVVNAAWWNTPIDITGKSIEVSFNAYFEQGFQADPPAHGEGLTFALVEGDSSGHGNNNHPAPVPFDPASTATDYGAGSGGLGFGGYDGNDTTGTGGVNNVNGDKNLALAVLTSDDDANGGTDCCRNVSRVGLLKGQRWQMLGDPPTQPDPHVRTGRWYGGSAATIDTQIYGGRAVPVYMRLTPKAANVWTAVVMVDGIVKETQDVTLPPTVFMGFTAGTFTFPEKMSVSDVRIAYGTPVAPTVTANPGSIDFGAADLGSTVMMTATSTNTGTVAADVSVASTPAGFGSSGLPVTLQPGEQKQVGVTFTPPAATAASGDLVLNVACVTGNGQTKIPL